jgi:hypothetical protein
MSDLISDQVRVLFAVPHESGCGTFETCRPASRMSGHRVDRTSPFGGQNDAIELGADSPRCHTIPIVYGGS